MSTPPNTGIVLVTSTGTAFTVPSGLSFSEEQNPTTGFLAVVVYGAGPGETTVPVAAFGSIAAVFQAGTVTGPDIPEARSPADPPT